MFYTYLLEQDNIKKKKVNKNIIELNANSNNKKYNVETI